MGKRGTVTRGPESFGSLCPASCLGLDSPFYHLKAGILAQLAD